MIVVVAVKLSNITVDLGLLSLDVTYRCLLGPSYHSNTICRYSYVACGLSLAASIGTAIVQLVSLDCCGVASLVDLCVGFGGGIWWMIAAAVITNKASNVNDGGLNLQNWRDLVIAMAWAEVALFLLVALTALLGFCL